MIRPLALLFTALSLSACGSDSGNCPSERAASSDLPVAPAASGAVPLHLDGVNATWQWQLTGSLNTAYAVDVYDVDLFNTSAAQIAALQGAGRTVVCYFAAGSSEDWRSDFDEFNEEDLGEPLDGWEGERWLDVRSQNVLDIMTARLDLAAAKGCDGVEPDNMDGFQQDTCFDLTASNQLAYNRAIANLARDRGLSVALKNDPDQVVALVDYFDFSVTEQCHQYSECAAFAPFTAAGKPVFNAEYENRYRSNPDQAALCADSLANSIRTLVLALDLDDSYRHSCD
ncbi:MAG: endo alpha-1,4 polygalactosaminidase [Bdellovibrionales bacterium]|nr:endo alpha-1,4 polygalactosaminidase [Bdellovibrionales bacterium]